MIIIYSCYIFGSSSDSLFEVTPNSYTENLHKMKRKKKNIGVGANDVLQVDVEDDYNNDDDERNLISKRESSHDFD